MDFAIRFIGIVMLFQVSTGQYRAYLPMSNGTDVFCGNTPPVHTAFIRVDNADIVDSTGWTDNETCDSGLCTLFRIATTSRITINPVYTPAGSVVGLDPTFCLIPKFKAEPIESNAKLHADPEARSIAFFDLPPGTLKGVQASSDMISSVLEVKAPVGARTTDNITIEAIGAAATRTLVVKPGTLITIQHMHRDHSRMDLNQSLPSSTGNTNHFFLYHKLLDIATPDCYEIPRLRPCTGATPVKPGTTLNLECSNTGCC